MKSKKPPGPRIALVVSSETSSIEEITQKVGRPPDVVFVKDAPTGRSWPLVHPFNIAIFRFDNHNEDLDEQLEKLGSFLTNCSTTFPDLRSSCATELHLEYLTSNEGGFMLRHDHISKIAIAQLDLLVSIKKAGESVDRERQA
jgi:hypothetical protein